MLFCAKAKKKEKKKVVYDLLFNYMGRFYDFSFISMTTVSQS